MTGFLLGCFPAGILVRWMRTSRLRRGLRRSFTIVAGEAFAQPASPCMTVRPPPEALLVLCNFENVRRHGAADEFPDRPWHSRRLVVREQMGTAWAQARDNCDRAARHLRLLAARQSARISAGEPLPALGSSERPT